MTETPWTHKIHLSFGFFDGEMPPKYKKALKKLTAQNPDMQIKIWGPEESRHLIATRYPWALKKYDSFKWPIQRSDMSRPAILHAEGGTYMDIDYKLKKPLSKLMEHLSGAYPKGEVFINRSPNSLGSSSLSNSLMLAKQPEHPFWLHFLKRISKINGNGRGFTRYTKIMSSTGPEAISRSYHAYEKDKRETVIPLPPSVFNPCSICDRGSACAHAPGVLAVHKNDSSWHSVTAKVYRHLYCNRILYYILIPCVIAAVVVIVVVCLRLKSCRATCAPCRLKNKQT